jgi:Holliday junction resolvasome RuvABC endonuclease subunit
MLPWIPIGLDLSLTSTGIAIGDATWVIEGKSLRSVRRLVYIRDRILDAISNHDDYTAPMIAIIEGYSFSSRNSQAHALGELGGVVRVALHEISVPVIEVPPTCRAKFATGRGNASKSEVVSAISARTGIVWDGPGAEDRCDAWILQEMAFANMGHARHSWPASHLAAIDKIDWDLMPVDPKGIL